MKRDLIIILLIDLVIVVGISGFIYKRYSDYIRTQKNPLTAIDVKENISEEPVPEITPRSFQAEQARKLNAGVNTNMHSSTDAASGTLLVFRNILFQYKSSKANKVAIIGDFNKWDPQPMTRETGNLWKIAIRLSPGKYAYNYLVDDRLILDPNNRNNPVPNARGFKSSIIEIKPK